MDRDVFKAKRAVIQEWIEQGRCLPACPPAYPPAGPLACLPARHGLPQLAPAWL